MLKETKELTGKIGQSATNKILENIRNEIGTLAKSHSVDVPIVYGDGTEATDKMISLTELGYILSEVFDTDDSVC